MALQALPQGMEGIDMAEEKKEVKGSRIESALRSVDPQKEPRRKGPSYSESSRRVRTPMGNKKAPGKAQCNHPGCTAKIRFYNYIQVKDCLGHKITSRAEVCEQGHESTRLHGYEVRRYDTCKYEMPNKIG